MNEKPRIVLDTNLLVGSAYARHSASRRIVDACVHGEVIALVSPAVQREYEFIYPRAVRRAGSDEALASLLRCAELVEPAHTPRVVQEDADDDKLLAAALAGRADAIVTNDRHLLRLDPYGPVRIVRPGQFVRDWLTQDCLGGG